jgi:hypothetical protein
MQVVHELCHMHLLYFDATSRATSASRAHAGRPAGVCSHLVRFLQRNVQLTVFCSIVGIRQICGMVLGATAIMLQAREAAWLGMAYGRHQWRGPFDCLRKSANSNAPKHIIRTWALPRRYRLPG